MHYGYMLRGQSTELYKVGITGNPKRRFAQYRTHVPEIVAPQGVKAFISKDEAATWESRILTSFRGSIVHGEWMRLSPAEFATIWASGLRIFGDCPVDVLVQESDPYSQNIVRMFQCASVQDVYYLDRSIRYLGGALFREFLETAPRRISHQPGDGFNLPSDWDQQTEIWRHAWLLENDR